MADRKAEKETDSLEALRVIEEPEMGLTPTPSQAADVWDGGWPQSPREFEALVNAYLDRLVRYAFCRLGNLQDAEDAVQEVFVRAFREQSMRKKIGKTGPYLYRMVANACTDFFRKRRLPTVPLEEIEVERIPTGGRTPAQAAVAAEEMRRAEELLQRLPTRQAEVLRLRVFDELSLREIADVIGCSVSTVSGRLRYGFRKLRKIVSRKRGIEQ